MTQIPQLITEHLDIWTSAETEKKAGRGRSNGNGDTVYGIKKLRELILELAVRGKLVPQDPKDEQSFKSYDKAIDLPDGYRRAGKQEIKEKVITTIQDLPTVPKSWIYRTVDQLYRSNHLLDYADGNHGSLYPRKGDFSDAGVIFLTAAQITEDSRIEWNQCSRLSHEKASQLTKGWSQNGDVLYTHNATVGRTAFADDCPEKQFLLGTSVTYYRINCETICPAYLRLYFSSPSWRRQAEKVMRQTTRNQVSITKQALFYVALPPLGEQLRVSSKVDELMALCDQLEAQHNNASDAHEKLVTHLLNTLTQSQNADDFAANWQRIAEHFDSLFTTEHSIDTLKQTLLQLAVMGKLVPQDPNDEPASELLKRIQAEKAKLIAAGKIKKEKPLPPISDEEKPFDLPAGWAFERLGGLLSFLNGYAFKSEWFVGDGVRLLRNINVAHGCADWSELACVTQDRAEEFPDYLLGVGDLVLSLDRPIISTGLKYAEIRESDLPCLLLQRVAKLSAHAKSVIVEFLVVWLNSPMFTEVLDPGRSNGVPHISTNQVAKMVFALPPFAEQRRVVDRLNELLSLCDHLKSRITESSQLKQKLADALVTQALTA